MRKRWQTCCIMALALEGFVVVIELNSLVQYITDDYVRQDFNAIHYFNSRIHERYSQQDKIRHLISKCHNTTLIRPEMGAQHTPIYYYSKNYNFSLCTVPKGGVTFWTQAFAVLEKGIQESEGVFKKPRYKIHSSSGKYTVEFSSDNRKRSQSILISRDPYSRLFSAFIDKSYLPNMRKLNIHINVFLNKLNNTNSESHCIESPTFEEFLRYVIHRGRTGALLDRHWASIYNLCRPCDVNAFILVNQENFSKDVEYSLEQVGVERDKYDVIVDALYGHRLEATVPGIVGTIMAKTKVNKHVKKCIGFMEVMRRTWTSFKIQGFLRDSISLPVDKFSPIPEEQYTETLIKELFTAMKDNPISQNESKAQRRAALVNAYADIREETINDIREIYHNDFEIFGYSKDTPRT